MNSGRHAQAGEIAGRLVSRHPRLGFLWTMYGAALARQGGDPLPALRRGVELAGNDPDAHYQLAIALHDRKTAAEAMTHYRTVLQLNPAHAGARVGYADLLLESGRYAESAAAYAQVLASGPARAEIHNNLGNAQQHLGELPEAASSFRRALELRPDFAPAYSNLGHVLRRQGLASEAVISCRRALVIDPNLADAHNNLGNALRDLGRPDEALDCYRRALEIRPESADVHANLGNLLRDAGALREALASYRRAVELNPSIAETHNNIGNVFLDLQCLDEAESSYLRALALRPGYVHAITALAMVRRLQGRSDEAETTCRQALELAPDCADAMAFLAELHADRGEFPAAEELCRRALDIDPKIVAAWAGLARYRRMGDGDSSWLAGAEALAASALPVRHEIVLRFALGKYFDDVAAHERAFQEYAKANELVRRLGGRYDRGEAVRRTDRIIRTYNVDWIHDARLPTADSRSPIFVIGMPRSGTTLAEQILASHPAVFGAGELPYWHNAVTAYEAAGGDSSAPASSLRALREAYLRQIASLSGGIARVVDKMPTNYLHLGMIHAALPEARFIHMQRDPIDTCLSIYFQNFSIAHAYASDLDDLAHHYVEYLRIMKHWIAVLPAGVILDVSYDGLVHDQEGWTRRMLEFAGLPWDARCLEFHATARTVLTPSKWQVRQHLNQRSSGRWRHYEKFIAPLRSLGVDAHPN
jgi:tetratricopeptide (TPR) repeat protein